MPGIPEARRAPEPGLLRALGVVARSPRQLRSGFMYTTTLGIDGPGPASTARYLAELAALSLKAPSFVVLYAVEDAPVEQIAAELQRRHPMVPIFGATSHQGVFTPTGFARGVALLVGQQDDGIRVAEVFEEVAPNATAEAAERACREIELRLGSAPNALILHATPGCEENVLLGIRAAFGTSVPVYGGSAADDAVSGGWRIIGKGRASSRGFVLAGVRTGQSVRGAFLGGYLPTGHVGTVTRAHNRDVYEIDHKPAAVVYNEWTGGAIQEEAARGGSVLEKTSLWPVARVVKERLGMPQRLLAQPHKVLASTRGLSFFSELVEGDEIMLMTSTLDPLIKRVQPAVSRARQRQSATRGGLLLYSGGCFSTARGEAARIAAEFRLASGDIPFIGLATFGEQGCFFDKGQSHHGNLMCAGVLFE
jgi:hypothetical protein